MLAFCIHLPLEGAPYQCHKLPEEECEYRRRTQSFGLCGPTANGIQYLNRISNHFNATTVESTLVSTQGLMGKKSYR